MTRHAGGTGILKLINVDGRQWTDIVACLKIAKSIDFSFFKHTGDLRNCCVIKHINIIVGHSLRNMCQTPHGRPNVSEGIKGMKAI